jgi:hypothetical protein
MKPLRGDKRGDRIRLKPRAEADLRSHRRGAPHARADLPLQLRQPWSQMDDADIVVNRAT